VEEAVTPGQQAAWLAYYTCLRDHPSSTPDERKVAKDMLAKGDKMRIRDLTDVNPEDLA
jgi:hypothetical protein